MVDAHTSTHPSIGISREVWDVHIYPIVRRANPMWEGPSLEQCRELFRPGIKQARMDSMSAALLQLSASGSYRSARYIAHAALSMISSECLTISYETVQTTAPTEIMYGDVSCNFRHMESRTQFTPKLCCTRKVDPPT